MYGLLLDTLHVVSNVIDVDMMSSYNIKVKLKKKSSILENLLILVYLYNLLLFGGYCNLFLFWFHFIATKMFPSIYYTEAVLLSSLNTYNTFSNNRNAKKIKRLYAKTA